MSNNTSSTLDTLEEQLERSIENVRQIQIIVSDFQPQGNQISYQFSVIFLVLLQPRAIILNESSFIKKDLYSYLIS